ncbi:MAG: TrbI/VirB10 family protein, partial [Ilumatobacter fluminis]
TVFDEIDGGIALIPQGSLITGTVSTQVEYGEERAFLVAQYIRIAGTNHYLDLGGVSAAGLDGTAGIHADVNNHYGRALGVGILTALLGTSSAVARAGLDDDRDSIEAESIAGGAVELQRVGGRFLERELRLRPTLTAKPGDQIAFILNRELQFDGGSP